MKKEKKELHLKDKKMAMKYRRDESKIKIPIQNMAYKDDPPAFVTVVGSKSSGKSTLIKALVKKLSKNTLENVLGPVTLTINKDKRITIFECQSDIHQFVDTSKISDLVIFVIDARVGLEMETFEYINLLMSHGLPKLLFVVTHCDKNNNQIMLKKIKKRIWSEVCDGLKFFYLGLENKNYTEIEFLNLVRSIKGMKYRPIEWKCSHSHIIVDNIDENHVYGYVRGGCIRKNIDIHIPGCGDTKIINFELLEDPVPIRSEGRLSLRRDILYGPMSYKEPENVEKDKHQDELNFDFNNEIKLFKHSSVPITIESDNESADVFSVINEQQILKSKYEKEDNDVKTDLTDVDKLKKLIKNKFRKSAENEEEWVDRFNLKYEEKTRNVENIIEKQREEILANKEKNLENRTSDVAYPGDYLKIELENPLSNCIDFSKILILGALNISETTKTVLQGKVKKSKWLKKLLKTNEPYIFSLGWRRFQSIPVFSSKTTEMNRMLKYSFCDGFSAINFYGNIVPPGTGFSIYSENGVFRILGQGTILDVTGDHKLVKKLKLVGYPKTITGNTVIVKKMFTSDLEVLKFKYGKLKTASGLKGIIKNPIGKKGNFRASFEGEMLLSDIIILRCYVEFPLYNYIIPVNNLYEKWIGLRTLKEIRDELGIKLENNIEEDSVFEDKYSNEDALDEEFRLPSEIEKELPLDKRQIKIVNEKIRIPIAPESRSIVEEIKRLEVLRIEKDKKDLIKQNEEREIKEKEYEEFMKVKEEKKKKKIVESALDKQKRHKGVKKKK